MRVDLFADPTADAAVDRSLQHPADLDGRLTNAGIDTAAARLGWKAGTFIFAGPTVSNRVNFRQTPHPLSGRVFQYCVPYDVVCDVNPINLASITTNAGRDRQAKIHVAYQFAPAGKIAARPLHNYGSQTSQAVPKLIAGRIAAEYGGKFSYVPTWLPADFHFVSWKVDAGHSGPSLKRLSIRFKRGTEELLWEVSGQDDTKTPAECRTEFEAEEIATVNRRKVFNFSNHTAFMCLDIKAKYGVASVSVGVTKARTQRNPNLEELRRMVGTSNPLPPGVASGSGMIPPKEARALGARFGLKRTLLPPSLPAGFLFTRWAVAPNHFAITFGRDGLTIQWGITARWDDYSCPSATLSGYGRKGIFEGRTVFYDEGTVGSVAWMCLPPPAGGAGTPLRVGLWTSNGHGRPSADLMMQTVAGARAPG